MPARNEVSFWRKGLGLPPTGLGYLGSFLSRAVAPAAPGKPDRQPVHGCSSLGFYEMVVGTSLQSALRNAGAGMCFINR